MEKDNPKLFISYSWTSPEHEQWVISLATNLRESGVDVILDKWDLKEGHDAYAFMEKMVTDEEIGKVILICDQNYAEKSDDRSGGVGTETQIITAEIYSKEDQNKFVAVVCERSDNGKAYLPTYYKSRIYIDLSEQDLFATNFEQLLRWVFDKPLHIKPELGNKPGYLSDTEAIRLGTSVSFRRALDAVRNNKNYAGGALNEYFETFIQNLEKIRIQATEGELDDEIVENIEQFIPYRNEAIEIFLALAQYRNTADIHKKLHRFIEGLIPYLYKPDHATSHGAWDSDNYQFIIHELFLYLIASLIKYECFDGASYLLRHHYYFERSYSANDMVSFAEIRQHMKSLEHRNSRKKLQRHSVRADMLIDRSKTSGLSQRQLMQADFIVYIRDCFDTIREDKQQVWWPETLLYIGRHGGAFEVFSRAQSEEYFGHIMCLFDINDKSEIKPLLEAFHNEQLRIPKWGFDSYDPGTLMGYETLATKP